MTPKKKAEAEEPETDDQTSEETPASPTYPLSADSPLYEPASTVNLNPAFVDNVE